MLKKLRRHMTTRSELRLGDKLIAEHWNHKEWKWCYSPKPAWHRTEEAPVYVEQVQSYDWTETYFQTGSTQFWVREEADWRWQTVLGVRRDGHVDTYTMPPEMGEQLTWELLHGKTNLLSVVRNAHMEWQRFAGQQYWFPDKVDRKVYLEWRRQVGWCMDGWEEEEDE